MKTIVRLSGLTFSIGLLAAFGWFMLNTQTALDYYYSYTFKPSAEVINIANRVGFTDKATFYFKAAQPELNSANEFNRYCAKKDAESAVLGCYIGPQNLYIYDVKDERLAGVREVTTAHEVLHVTYDRLSATDKSNVDILVREALPSVLAQKSELADRLKVYDKIEPGERANELHSILGTEVEDLPAELETYYAQYFKDRSIVVGFAKQYTKNFTDIKENQEQLVGELKELSTEINILTTTYNANIAELNDRVAAFNARASRQGGFETQEEFNQVRAELMMQRQELDATRNSINAKSEYYNAKRDELQTLNVKVEELQSQLDSTKVPQL